MREIVGRASDGIVGDISSDDEVEEDGGESHGRDVVGSRKNARDAGTRGVRKRRTDGEELVGNVYMMSEDVSDLVKTMAADNPPEVDYVEIDARVVATVKRELQETNNPINQQKELLEDLKDLMVVVRNSR